MFHCHRKRQIASLHANTIGLANTKSIIFVGVILTRAIPVTGQTGTSREFHAKNAATRIPQILVLLLLWKTIPQTKKTTLMREGNSNHRGNPTGNALRLLLMNAENPAHWNRQQKTLLSTQIHLELLPTGVGGLVVPLVQRRPSCFCFYSACTSYVGRDTIQAIQLSHRTVPGSWRDAKECSIAFDFRRIQIFHSFARPR
mmetsp:Transcript_4111/g.8521  ORF Transcript_4111/g.8521 Transcript_4111/m.8521 type:complete len:200 (+) Transcript_4111:314-913(+)